MAFTNAPCMTVSCQAVLLQKSGEKSESLLEGFQSTQIKHLKLPSSKTHSDGTGSVVSLSQNKSSFEMALAV